MRFSARRRVTRRFTTIVACASVAIATLVAPGPVDPRPVGASEPVDVARTWGAVDDALRPSLDGAVAAASTSDGSGVIAVSADGRAVTTGAVGFHGDASGLSLRSPIVDVDVSATGDGYWMTAADGGVFAFGAARYFGSVPEVLAPGSLPDRPISAIAATPTGRGYWLFAADGGVFAFGDAVFLGSIPGVLPVGTSLDGTIVDAVARGQSGYLLVGRDGGVFAFGAAPFHGSAAPEGRDDIIGIVNAGIGYRIATSDGTVRSYGTPHHGNPERLPISAIAGTADGYWLIDADLSPAQPGDKGPMVAALQQRLHGIGFWAGSLDGEYGHVTSQAVMAFQKWTGLDRTGRADQATIDSLRTAVRPTPASTEGDLIEIDIERQLIFIVRDGAAEWVFNTSTGSEIPYQSNGRWYHARTPTGVYDTYFERPNGWRVSHLGRLWRPKYFNGGIAIHGSGFIPGWPDSHGCSRVSIAAMDFFYDADLAPVGTTVWVY